MQMNKVNAAVQLNCKRARQGAAGNESGEESSSEAFQESTHQLSVAMI